jgi:hypothetical protein
MKARGVGLRIVVLWVMTRSSVICWQIEFLVSHHNGLGLEALAPASISVWM